jgi:hypothetical protein
MRGLGLACLGLVCSVVMGCGLVSSQPTGTPPVVQLMPDLPGYRVIEGEAVQDYIAKLADGAALLSGNPEMIVLIEKVDGVIACYQEAGAVNFRIFSREDFPLSSGAIAIVDRNRLTDPATLFRCVGGEMIITADELTLDPCAHSYTLERDDNAFHIIYVGTTREICQTFCENLEGCSR